MPGMLALVATPIGNLSDITLRALETLRMANLIACEDTRQTAKLLRHHQIHKPLVSLHEHNERARTAELLERIRGGQAVALVCDGGTPLINDPGWWLVHRALEEHLPVTWIPGPTALIGGLVLSGLPTDRFIFEGFLPTKPGQRRRRLEALNAEARTVILYESPHRLLKTLRAIREVLGDIQVSCARELTKQFEEVVRGSLTTAIRHFEQRAPRGEFVLVLDPSHESRSTNHGP